MPHSADSYFSTSEQIGLIQGDSFDIMREMIQAKLKFGAIVTDPPYSSGGLTSQDRRKNPVRKYHQTGTAKQFPSFVNDMRDMRTHYFWTVDWLRLALQLTTPGGLLLIFSDWRQNALTSDALQVAGWTYRGLVVWDKTDGTRPQRGLFRNQCEYIHVASNGDMPPMRDRPNKFAPGCFRVPIIHKDKHHLTGKPVPLMIALLDVLPDNLPVLDPFAGSSSTLRAARTRGLAAVGIEMSPEYVAVSRSLLWPDTSTPHLVQGNSSSIIARACSSFRDPSAVSPPSLRADVSASPLDPFCLR